MRALWTEFVKIKIYVSERVRYCVVFSWPAQTAPLDINRSPVRLGQPAGATTESEREEREIGQTMPRPHSSRF